MNEVRDLIIGFDFGKKYTQISYYDRVAEETRSVSMKVGSDQIEAPTCLCWRSVQKDYKVGIEAEYFAKEKGGIMINDLYDICCKEDSVNFAGEEKKPWELLGYFLEGMLKFLGVADVVKHTKCIVITSETLDLAQVLNYQRACEFIGFDKKQYMLFDYEESFFYYALTQQREVWNRSVGWYEFDGNHVLFRKLVMNSSVKPILVHMEGNKEINLPKNPAERDEQFYKFVQETVGRELFSSIQITGNGFEKELYEQSIRLMCYQKRKVYLGSNLFASGACLAGKEKKEDKRLNGYLYLSSQLILTEVGMNMKIMGSPTYYMLMEAGKNWYEYESKCEIILDHTKELVFIYGRIGDEEKRKAIMNLPGMPDRPAKTTRISLELRYVSAKDCQITVRDIGFGDLYPSSGKVWKEIIRW